MTLLRSFVRIADAGSISAAARDLGLSQPTASRHLAELESRLKSQLVRRTTHSLALTAAGRELLTDARRLLGAWESLEEKHLGSPAEARGLLTVVAPIALGQQQLMALAAEFLEAHPGVSLSWRLEDGVIRFAEVGCDCWIKIGPVPDESLVVKKVGEVERLVVAAEGLWRQIGHRGPVDPQVAESWPWLVLDPFEGHRIPMHSKTGESFMLRPEPRLRTDSVVALREAVSLGLGVAVLPRWYVDSELRDGSLVDCWPAWRAPTLSIHVARLPGRYVPRRLELFFEHIRTVIPKLPGISPVP